MDSLNPNIDCNEYNPFVNKKKNSKFNQEQLNYIKELLDLGWTPNQICKKFNLPKNSKKSINQRLTDNNWKANSNRSSCLTNEELLQIQEDIKNGLDHEVIAKKYSISLESLENRIANNKWERAHRKNKYTLNETYFDEIDTEHKAYWIGFLMADGYILSPRNRKTGGKEQQSFGVTLNIKDIKILEELRKDLNSNNPINCYKNGKPSYKEDSVCCRILFTSQHMVDALKKVGIVENKTFFTKMPPLKEELIPHFIRGYSDGDGSIVTYKIKGKKEGYYNKCFWQLCGTQELLNSIKSFFQKDNLKLSQRWPERENNNWELKFSGYPQCKRLLDIIYKDATIYLQRKYDKYVEIQGMNG